MPSPFPGMDPYLEEPQLWRGFHHHLAEEIVRALNRSLDEKYFADVDVEVLGEEARVAAANWMVSDVGVLESARGEKSRSREPSNRGTALLEAPLRRPVVLPERVKNRAVRVYRRDDRRIVTTLEILSPFNKRPGEGLWEYRKKRERILVSPVHLIEIDLLRGGERPGLELAEPPIEMDYVGLVNRADESTVRVSEIWPVALKDPLPLLPVPLLAPDSDVALDLGRAIQAIYESSRYGSRIDYSRPPPPPLRPEMEAWIVEKVVTPRKAQAHSG